ncbi:transcriptional regulator [Paenibacillus rhizovicinus]|uniref:Transcriptional regulator n=1 Tax=Paenibacillus rhizovicinus TaxID=2704463 RepID=A0A6C0P3V3_9BACL|nr:transcriptional regulator [Paenibacillus rhizovicinus]QHW33159.1 transcriptional regulator [Paenibacillus rhizovicinus]
MRISQKNLEIACSILNYTAKNGMPPTVDEIRNFVGLRSHSSIYAHLKRLQEEGIIDWDAGGARTLKVVQTDYVVREYERFVEEKSDYLYK